MELKVGMKAIIVNCQHHTDYNFQICEIREIENSKRIQVELHKDKFITKFYVKANEIIPILYENPEDLKKWGTTVDDIAKLFSEYKAYYDLICKVAEDMFRESDENEKKYKSQIEEMQQHINCIKSDLEEVQYNKFEFPTEPIKVAEMLIDEKRTYETSSIARAFGAGDAETYNLYSKSDLRQIAKHLLVYCNNTEDGD